MTGGEPTSPAAGEPAGGGALMRAGARGAMWLGLAQVLGKGAVLLTTVVLARLLTPAEFGLVSLAVVLIVYAEAVADAGVAQALIYLPRRPAVIRAALLCALTTGLLLMLVTFAVAPLIAAFFDNDAVEPLVRLLAVSLFGSALGAVPESLLRRDLLFPRVTAATVVKSVATGAVSVSLALLGYGAYALVWGTLAGSAAYVLITWALLPDRPDLALWRTTRADIRSVIGYGMPVAGSNLLARLVFDVDYLIVGRLLGAAALGYYTLAFRLPELVIINVFYILSAVVFPIYSRVRDDPAMLSRGYLFSVRVFSLYGTCAGVGLAVTAPLVVPVLFGHQWDASVVPLVGLALYAGVRSMSAGANEVYKATGRPGLSLKLSVARLVVLVPALLLAAHWWGIVGVAWMQLAAAAVFAVAMQGLAARVLGLRARQILGALRPGLLAGAAVAVAGLALARIPLPPALSLVVVVVGGAAAALAALRFGARPVLQELLPLLRPGGRAG